MEQDDWGPLGPITESPDDLMDVPVEILITRLAMRVTRLRRFEELAAESQDDVCGFFSWILKRERALVHAAETAARARIRELALLLFDQASCLD